MSLLLSAILFAFLAVTSVNAELYKISNKALTIGIETDLGGAITWLSDNNVGRNLINCYDEGREVQQSYYSGPDDMCKWGAHPWPWNPISAGDQHGHKSHVLQVDRTSTSLYIRVRPLQWACNNVLCDCFFETWIDFGKNVNAPQNSVVVKNRLTNFRKDQTVYPPRDQELPAVYTIGSFSDLFVGNADGTTYTQVSYPVPGPPWGRFTVGGKWMAAAMPTSTNRGNYAVGVYNPNVTTFLGGFYGTPSPSAGSEDDATMYMAPINQWALEANTTKTWCFALALGYLESMPGTFNYYRQHGVEC